METVQMVPETTIENTPEPVITEITQEDINTAVNEMSDLMVKFIETPSVTEDQIKPLFEKGSGELIWGDFKDYLNTTKVLKYTVIQIFGSLLPYLVNVTNLQEMKDVLQSDNYRLRFFLLALANISCCREELALFFETKIGNATSEDAVAATTEEPKQTPLSILLDVHNLLLPRDYKTANRIESRAIKLTGGQESLLKTFLFVSGLHSETNTFSQLAGVTSQTLYRFLWVLMLAVKQTNEKLSSLTPSKQLKEELLTDINETSNQAANFGLVDKTILQRLTEKKGPKKAKFIKNRILYKYFETLAKKSSEVPFSQAKSRIKNLDDAAKLRRIEKKCRYCIDFLYIIEMQVGPFRLINHVVVQILTLMLVPSDMIYFTPRQVRNFLMEQLFLDDITSSKFRLKGVMATILEVLLNIGKIFLISSSHREKFLGRFNERQNKTMEDDEFRECIETVLQILNFFMVVFSEKAMNEETMKLRQDIISEFFTFPSIKIDDTVMYRMLCMQFYSMFSYDDEAFREKLKISIGTKIQSAIVRSQVQNQTFDSWIEKLIKRRNNGLLNPLTKESVILNPDILFDEIRQGLNWSIQRHGLAVSDQQKEREAEIVASVVAEAGDADDSLPDPAALHVPAPVPVSAPDLSRKPGNFVSSLVPINSFLSSPVPVADPLPLPGPVADPLPVPDPVLDPVADSLPASVPLPAPLVAPDISTSSLLRSNLGKTRNILDRSTLFLAKSNPSSDLPIGSTSPAIETTPEIASTEIPPIGSTSRSPPSWFERKAHTIKKKVLGFNTEGVSYKNRISGGFAKTKTRKRHRHKTHRNFPRKRRSNHY